MAVSNPFVFGEFQVYEGRDSYTLSGANVKEYFLDLAQMQPGVYYGFYFLELAEYFSQEGNDETQMLNLLYVTMNAIRRGRQDLRLIRCILSCARSQSMEKRRRCSPAWSAARKKT